MRILILGSEGFLGSYITKECKNLNLNFIPINRSIWNQLLKENLQNWLISQKITDIIFCCGFSKRFNVQDIEKIKEFETLNYLLKNSNCRIIYLSSTLVYGFEETNFNLVNENAICKPSGAYGMYKRLIEKLVLDANEENCVARLVSCIGKRKKSGLFKSIEKQISEAGKSIEMNHGNTTRDYLWVVSAAKLITELAINKKAKGIYNIGSGKGLKVSEIIERFSIFYKKQINIKDIKFGPLMPEDPEYLLIDVKKIQNIISNEENLKIFEVDQIEMYLNEFKIN